MKSFDTVIGGLFNEKWLLKDLSEYWLDPYDEIKRQLSEDIAARKNIILYGDGNNGKTYLINEFRQQLLDGGYSVEHQMDEFQYNRGPEPYIMEEFRRFVSSDAVVTPMSHIHFNSQGVMTIG